MKKETKVFKKMNILMIVCIIIFGEIFAYVNELILGAKFHDGKLFAPYSMKIERFEKRYEQAKKRDFGKVYGKNYSKSPVILFGGSYVYGYGLKDEEKLAYALSENLKRPVYNMAYQTWSVQNMLWQLKRDDFYSDKKMPYEIIYMGVKVDLDNANNPDILNGLKYHEKNGKLEEVPFFFMLTNYSYLLKKINQEISYRKTMNRTESIKFFNKHIIESANEVKKHWKDTKMTVVWYDLPKTDDFKELEDVGIKVVSLDLFIKENILKNKKYKNSENDIHPNAKAWEVIVPEMVKQAEL